MRIVPPSPETTAAVRRLYARVRVLRNNGSIVPVEDWLHKSLEVELELPAGFSNTELLLKAVEQAVSRGEQSEGDGPHPNKELRKSEEWWLQFFDWDDLAERVLGAAKLRMQKAISARPPEMDERTLRRIIHVCQKFFSRNFNPVLKRTLQYSLTGLSWGGNEVQRYILPILAKEQKWVEMYIRSWLWKLQAEVASDAAKEILLGYREGKHPTETAAAIRDRIAGKESPYVRDWRRVAITEHNRLTGTGVLATVPEGGHVVGMSFGNACERCKELVDGKVLRVIAPPARPTAKEWDTAIWVTKSNIGRGKADWKPCVTLHPNDRCVWQSIAIDRWYIDTKGFRQPRAGNEKAWAAWRSRLSL
jgi:hypothetical protein